MLLTHLKTDYNIHTW